LGAEDERVEDEEFERALDQGDAIARVRVAAGVLGSHSTQAFTLSGRLST
jgi:hypothetical protein